MSTEPESRAERWREPAVAQYALMGLVALAVVFLVLVQRGLGVWALAPVLAGLVGSGMRLGPVLFLLALTVVLDMRLRFGDRVSGGGLVLVPELILCGAVLAYVIAHYRLQGMFFHIFPPDPRRRERARGRARPLLRRKARVLRPRRSPRVVSPQEIAAALLAVPAFVVLAQLLWSSLPSEALAQAIWKDIFSRRGDSGFLPPIWHGLVLLWLIGLGWLVAAGLLSAARWRQVTPEEATLYLQDILWAQTRREQRRLNRWLVWSRRREAQREDNA